MAFKQDFPIDQGSDFEIQLTLTDEDNAPINLTGFEFRGSGKKLITDDEPEFEFDIDILDQSVPANLGLVNVSLSNTITTALEAINYLYDIEMENAGGTIQRVVQGKICVNAEVTK